MTRPKLTALAQGNRALRDKDYVQAIRYYLQALENSPALAKTISQNIATARQKYSAERKQAEPQQIAVCGWELSHNAAGRVYTLAKLYQTFAQVEIIGSIFPQYGSQIWEPIRNTDIPIHHFTVNEQSQFIQQALQLVTAHPYDCVHLSKPRMPNIIIGLLYKLIWGAKVLVDIDDEELAFVGAETTLDLEQYLQQHQHLPELTELDGSVWTRLAVGLVKQFDGISVSNPALQQRYGGTIIRHARDENCYIPSPERKQKSRAAFNIPQDKKVVLFCGTPRPHKGLIETAQAIASLKRNDIVFAIVGDFPEPALKNQLQAMAGVDYRFIPNQAFDSMPDVVAIGDICVLLQDPASPVSQFQVPAKLSDALGMGLLVLAESSPALADLEQKNVLISCSQANLAQTLQDLLKDSVKIKSVATQAHEVFTAEMGCRRNGEHLQQVLKATTTRTMQVFMPLINQWSALKALSGQAIQTGSVISTTTSSLAQRLQRLNNTLIDWSKLAQTPRQQDLVSIIIPVYNQPELTTACIQTLYQHTPANRCEVIIVDNGSDTKTQKTLAELQQTYKSLKVIRQQENLNFALGSNLGFAASQGANVVFLNNDTEVTENWLEPIIAPLAKSEIVAVQPKLLYPDGTIQCIGVVFSDKSALGYPIYAGMKPEGNLGKESRAYQAVTGACMALRAQDFIQAKGFDSIYINGQEDIDLCLRLIQRSQGNCRYTANATVYHYESKSIGRFQYVNHNREIFISRWGDKIHADDISYYKNDEFKIYSWEADRFKSDDKHLSGFRPKLEKIIRNKDIQLISRNSIAVCVHVFYEHLWEKISSYLQNIHEKYDLYVSCPADKYNKIKQMILLNYPDAYIVCVENKGMDVFPFLFMNQRYKLWSYGAVLKLHTKNNKTRDREIMGKMLFDGVLGSSELCKDIVHKLTKENILGLIGAECLCRSANYIMYGNRDLVNKLFDMCAISTQEMDWGFIAGTMFWIRGELLKPLADLYSQIYEMFREIEDVNTGGDGTYAHAMERFFGVLPCSKGYRMGLSYQCDLEGKVFKVRTLDSQDLSRDSLYRIGSAYFIERYINASDWGNVLKKNHFFDEKYYRLQAKKKLPIDMDPVFHYIMYGDIFLLSPSSEFSTQYYLLRYKDIVRSRMSPLVHYLTKGQHEGRIALPSSRDWLDLAVRENLFNIEWYEENYSIRKKENLEVIDLYMIYGFFLYKNTSNNFIPSAIPVLNDIYNSRIDLLTFYLKEHILVEYEYYDLLERCYENKDFCLALKITNFMIGRFGMTKALMEILGAIQLLTYEWDLANDTWATYWKHVLNDNFVTRCKSSILKIDRPVDENKDFDILIQQKQCSSQLDKENKKICVYTALFGNIDDLLPVVGLINGVDFICFSDRPRNNCGWEVRVVNPGMESSNMNAKIFKILPHRFLAEYEFSLFVDANTLLLGRINSLLSLCMQSGRFVMWRHPLRRDVYLEIIAIITSKRHEPKKLLKQVKVYSENGLPNNSGLVEGSFIWRQHSDLDVKNFMEEWWKEIQKFSYRDQVSLGYLMWKKEFKPVVFPEKMGTSRENEFFIKIPHKKNEYICDAKDLNVVSGHKNIKMDIVFLYSEKFLNSGSTIMRGRQLCKIISNNIQDNRKVIFSASTDISSSIIILTKGYLKITTADSLRRLKLKGNILLADFVDEPPNEALINDLDGLIASSILAYKYYKVKWPNKESFHITHHVDPRIGFIYNRFRGKNNLLDLNIGYFGELINSKMSDKIKSHVDFVSIDTSKVSTDWMLQLPSYNCHYAVRQRRDIDGYKPFLKGFVAAYCNANIIIQESEGDASFYLGSDYPFLINQDAGETEILEMLRIVKDAYNGPDWYYGLEVMNEIKARSSNEFVVREFMQMINSI